MSGELLEFDGGVYGMAQNLEEDLVGAVCWAQTRISAKAIRSSEPNVL